MAAIAQLGQAVIVGFNGVTYADFVMEDGGEENIGDVEEIRDANNATGTKLISNKGKRYTVTGVVKSGGTELATLRALEVGDTVSINSTNCMVEAMSLSVSRVAARATITAVVEDSMTYS